METLIEALKHVVNDPQISVSLLKGYWNVS